MRGYLSLLFGRLIIEIMLLVPGNFAQAAEQDDHCGCEVTMMEGAERNKIVAELLKSNGFKATRLELIQEGYTWLGAGETEIIINHTHGDMILIGVMFNDLTGGKYSAGYFYIGGKFIYAGLAPY